ncbi:PH domain-containing protein [Shouchella shacheensis]|uniref:PH domain-containing protein n=1 Tax=Shouchella shacheensis TaxID=1649580 RepID=UPI00073FBAA9|nr:PH domain-containing protein [Shouchella shacheensis]
MGLLAGLLGNASQVDNKEVEREVSSTLVPNEEVDIGFKVVRDLIVFTDKRLILVDKQGMTGKKIEYHTIPYHNIAHYSVETAGTFDLEAELKIWVSGTPEPIVKPFKKDKSIIDVQKALSMYVLG